MTINKMIEELKDNSRIKELKDSEFILIQGIINFIVYERKQDSYRGWWGKEVKNVLENLLKENIISGDGNDYWDIYKEVKEKEKK